MKINPKITGDQGEKIASTYLLKIGYKILDRKFRKRYNEADIMALDDKTLVIVEVKTRKDTLYGYPEESITSWKQKRLEKTLYYYKLLHPDLPDSLRIDVISIILDSADKIKRFRHFKNITG